MKYLMSVFRAIDMTAYLSGTFVILKCFRKIFFTCQMLADRCRSIKRKINKLWIFWIFMNKDVFFVPNTVRQFFYHENWFVPCFHFFSHGDKSKQSKKTEKDNLFFFLVEKRTKENHHAGNFNAKFFRFRKNHSI